MKYSSKTEFIVTMVFSSSEQSIRFRGESNELLSVLDTPLIKGSKI